MEVKPWNELLVMVTSAVRPEISSPEFVWSLLPRVTLLTKAVLVTVPVLFAIVTPGIAWIGKIWLSEIAKVSPAAMFAIAMPLELFIVEPAKLKLGGASASMQAPEVEVLF